MESSLTKVANLADRAAEALAQGDKKAYVALEQQCQDCFPNHVQLFYSTVQSVVNQIA